MFLEHVNLTVTNVDRTVAFYRELFGLDLRWEGTTSDGKRAAHVGFEWPNIDGALGKLDEEMAELKAELASADDARLRDEIGDVLFSVVNVARHLKIDPEAALRDANAKFERRFHAVEAGLAAEGRDFGDASLDDMEAHWQRAKQEPGG